jgi:sulfonate transport system substrate-binding protein
MAMVDANGKEHAISSNQFYLIEDLAGALASLKKQETDVFYWEKFTTKPYVDAGELRRIGEFYTPWSCFVIAATDKIIAEQPDNLIRTLRTIFDANDAFMQNERAAEMVSERYALQKADADRWFHATEWAMHGWVSDKMLKSVVYSLKTAGIIEQGTFVPELIWRRE